MAFECTSHDDFSLAPRADRQEHARTDNGVPLLHAAAEIMRKTLVVFVVAPSCSRPAKTLGDGAFAFADSNPQGFSSDTKNTFRVRATGGVRSVIARLQRVIEAAVGLSP